MSTTAGTAGLFLKDFPIVCIGGSAGGLDAYTRLLQHLPADLGVAIVIVNHVRTMPTLLHEILPRFTTMPIDFISESLLIEPSFLSSLKIVMHMCMRGSSASSRS